jgi:hypothetical protein
MTLGSRTAVYANSNCVLILVNNTHTARFQYRVKIGDIIHAVVFLVMTRHMQRLMKVLRGLVGQKE